jgi:glycosyltransferase involved in cell wall biosynthesis
MSVKPLISAIIIFLNEEKFIQEAIESVFAQTYDNWELLLVDDGSTDSSTAIARRYAEKYPEKVRYLEHDGHRNLGMSASRNLGFHNAKGEYISFLDGDDVWLPHKLEQQVAILESQPEAAMVYGPLQVWYSWLGNPEYNKRDHLMGVNHNGVHPYSNSLVKPPALLNLFLRDEFFIPGGIMVRRNVLESVGGYEEVFRGMYEDAVVLVKICLTSAVFVSSECWYRYRSHWDSYTDISWEEGRFYADRLFYLNWVEEYLSKQGVKDPEVWKSLRKAKWPYRHPTLNRLLEIYRHFFNPIQWHGLMIFIAKRTLPISLRRWLRTVWQAFK